MNFKVVGGNEIGQRPTGRHAASDAVRIDGDLVRGLFNGALLSMLVWLPLMMWLWTHIAQRGFQ